MVALEEAGLPPDHQALVKAADWMLSKQVLGPGDWQVKNKDAEPGGWAFEFRNDFYPDVDDTAMAVMVLRQTRTSAAGEQALVARAASAEAARRGLDWLLGMQNADGGWASFDRGNDKRWL